jgi:hypothetical protein
MMIGGENSFGAGGWRGTAVDPILPAMDEAEGGGWQDGLVRARPVQREHPILQVSDDLARSAAVVRQLPELDGCTRLVARNGSQVLLASPVGGWPLLTVWDRGKGRVAAVGMNTTWRWALQMPTAEAYTALWRNMFRWLSKTADQGAWQLKFDRDSAAVGQAYQLKVRAPAGTLAPQARVWLRDPAGNRTALPLERMGSAEWAAHGFVSQPGVYQASLDASSARGAAHHTAVLRVDAASVRESLALTINEPALQGIATARAGGYFKSNAVQVTDIQRIARAVTAPAQAEQVALWDHVMFMLLIVLLLVAEWYIRRRN